MTILNKFIFKIALKYLKFQTIIILIKYFKVIQASENVFIAKDIRINNFLYYGKRINIYLKKNSKIFENVKFQGNGKILLGENSTIGPNSIIDSNKRIMIGKNVLIADNVSLRDSDHNFSRIDIPINRQGINTNSIRIHDDVWIGQNVIITKGVKIGKGSVIGANSVVTKSIPEYSVAIGSPAKVIKSRK